jgi:hypothetical protein
MTANRWDGWKRASRPRREFTLRALAGNKEQDGKTVRLRWRA